MTTLRGLAIAVSFLAALIASRMTFDAYGGVDLAAVGIFAGGLLLAYGLLDPVQTPDMAPHMRCWRLSDRGRPFAERVWREWRRQPLWRRLAVRVTG